MDGTLSGVCPVCGGPTHFARARVGERISLECVRCGRAQPIAKLYNDDPGQGLIRDDMVAMFRFLMTPEAPITS